MEAILRRVIRRTAKALVGYEDSEADALAALQAAEADRRELLESAPEHDVADPVYPD